MSWKIWTTPVCLPFCFQFRAPHLVHGRYSTATHSNKVEWKLQTGNTQINSISAQTVSTPWAARFAEGEWAEDFSTHNQLSNGHSAYGIQLLWSSWYKESCETGVNGILNKLEASTKWARYSWSLGRLRSVHSVSHFLLLPSDTGFFLRH